MLEASLPDAVPSDGALVAPALSRHGSVLLLAARSAGSAPLSFAQDLHDETLGVITSAMDGWRRAYAAFAASPQDAPAQQVAEAALQQLLAVAAAHLAPSLIDGLARAGLPPAKPAAKLAPELVICATGIAGQLPWHALPLPDGGVLGEAYAVSFSPGVAARAAAAARVARLARAAPSALGVFDPAPHHGSPALGLAATLERDAVARWFGCIEVLEGEAASKQAVLARAAGRTHVHLACHGRFDADDPWRAGLELGGATAEAGFWSVAEIAAAYPLLDGCRLVFANGCETAQADLRHLPGEAQGLIAAFLRAGAAAAVANQWLVTDDAARRFAAAFYAAHLGEGLSPAQAGRRALITLRRQGDGTRSTARLAPPPGAARSAVRTMGTLGWAPFTVWGA